MSTFPKVSFLTPVLNEENNIEDYLKSIVSQDYPPENIEIIIADGGSTDRTIEIAKKYPCKILHNPNKCAESGLILCEKNATGKFFSYMAADNRLPHRDWINKSIAPLIGDPSIKGVYTHIVPSALDTSFNRYYSLLHVEPFSWFIYGNACNPKFFHKKYPVNYASNDYVIYDFSVMEHPLIAFAQGFIVASDFKRKLENEGDDILPFIQLIDDGKKIAYVRKTGIVHLHLKSFTHFLKKYQWRIQNSLYKNNVGFDNRRIYLSKMRIFKKYLWVIYGLSFVLPSYHSIKWLIRDREWVWLWHVPASFSLAGLIVFEYGRKILKKGFAK